MKSIVFNNTILYLINFFFIKLQILLKYIYLKVKYLNKNYSKKKLYIML